MRRGEGGKHSQGEQRTAMDWVVRGQGGTSEQQRASAGGSRVGETEAGAERRSGQDGDSVPVVTQTGAVGEGVWTCSMCSIYVQEDYVPPLVVKDDKS